VAAENILVADPHTGAHDLLKREAGVNLTTDNEEAARWGEVLVMAVKPNTLSLALAEVGQVVNPACLVLSVVAGKRIQEIESAFPAGNPVVRAMPNSAAQVRRGACAISPGTHATDAHIAVAKEVFSAVGTVVQVPETMLDGVTALSGSGPAYVYLMIEALIDGGVKVGLPREVASQLATQTVLGAAQMIVESGRHPAELKDMVATPGGTTIAALASLEQAGVRAALMRAVEEACRRAGELAS
jgi:pyrroline-5-carboxylate reductase